MNEADVANGFEIIKGLIWSCQMTKNVSQIFGLRNRMSFVFGLPDITKTQHLHVVSSKEAHCIIIRQLAYSRRYCDMIPKFVRKVCVVLFTRI